MIPTNKMEENNKKDEHSMSDLEMLSDRLARRTEMLGHSHAYDDIYRIVLGERQKIFAKSKKLQNKKLDFDNGEDVIRAYEDMHRINGRYKAYNEMLDFLETKLDESFEAFDKLP